MGIATWLYSYFALAYINLAICERSFSQIDNTLFDIKWPGPIQSELSFSEHTMVVKSADNEMYYCVLPDNVRTSTEEEVVTYDGPSEYELIQPLFDQTTCSYRIESYWTYELCHGKYLRQYHEEKDLKQKTQTQEYILGKFDRIKDGKDYAKHESETKEMGDKLKLPKKKIPTSNIDGMDFPYFQMNFTGGTPCDLTATPRKAYLRYVCHEEGRGEIYELKESATCEYEIVVLTSYLCSHPAYRQKTQPVNHIKCHSVEGAPRHPKNLEEMDLERAQTFVKQDSFRKILNKKVIQIKLIKREEGN